MATGVFSVTCEGMNTSFRFLSAVTLGWVLLFSGVGISAKEKEAEFRVLVFSRTAGFRHGSIEDGVAAVRKLGEENRFAVEASEDRAVFSPENLKRFQAVIFLNTTGDIL